MPKSHTELIHCDNCGEDFAATYRRCPFCNAKPGQRAPKDDAVDYHEPAEPVEYEPAYDTRPIFRNGGGKRLAGGGGGGGYRQRRNGPPIGKILLYVGTALVILAAVWIITVKVLPRFFPAQSSVEPSPSPTEAVTPTPVPPSPSVEPTEAVTPTPDVTPTDPVAVTDAPAPSPSVSAAPSALTLSSVDFTHPRVAGLDQLQRLHLDLKLAVRLAHHDGLLFRSAHHDALDEGLPAAGGFELGTTILFFGHSFAPFTANKCFNPSAV